MRIPSLSILFTLHLLHTFTAGFNWISFPDPIVVTRPNILKWQGNHPDRPATILLLQGGFNGGLTNYVQTITTNATGGSYTWTPLAQLTNGADYWLDISQDGDIETREGVGLTGGQPAGSADSPVTSIADGQPQAATQTQVTQTQATQTGATAASAGGPGAKQSRNAGLSTTVVVGIGVGAAVLIIALVAALVLVCYKIRKLRSSERSSSPVISKPYSHESFVELRDKPLGHRFPAMFEKDSRTSLWELGTRANRYEIGGKVQSTRYELGG